MLSEFIIDAPRSKALDDYLTHFLVVCINGEDVAIGEAGAVRKIYRNKWYAQVGIWLVSSISGQLEVYQKAFSQVSWQTVARPNFKLVPKKKFSGTFLGKS